jgi:DNA/RNA non-specific endonuclease
MSFSDIPYQSVFDEALISGENVSQFLQRELFWLWHDAYLKMSNRITQPVIYAASSFVYLLDSHDECLPQKPPPGYCTVDSRLIAVIGQSLPKTQKRDDGRLRGLNLSSNAKASGPWDRGHFIGHSIGGSVDGNEANVFLQLRSINRGRYRKMEEYCLRNPGVTLFSRPIYNDTAAHPFAIEFGIFKPDNELWIERMPNR